MVKMRSTRQDRTLLIAVWVLTAIVLVLGGLAGSPILLVWGTVGLIAAIYLTRVHVRDMRADRRGPAAGAEAGAQAADGDQPGQAGDTAADSATPATSATSATPATSDASDVEESR